MSHCRNRLKPRFNQVTGLLLILFLQLSQANYAYADSAKKILVFSKFVRLSDKPILGPRPGKFDSAGAFNPAATLLANGHTVLLYRGQDESGVSRIGYAESSNGIDFIADDKPVMAPSVSIDNDAKDGIEDARLTLDFAAGKTKADNSRWLATATAYSKATDAAQLVSYHSLAGDLHQWQRVAVLMPATTDANKLGWNVHWTKSGAIVVDSTARPLKINGKYWMYYMGDARSTTNSGSKMAADQMGVAQSLDGTTWRDALGRPVLPHRPGMFDSRVVEPGPHPIITKDGILLLYNGGDYTLTYRTGWALFDKKDPTILLARSNKAIFEPELAWEKKNASNTVHQVPNVVFVEGIVPHKKGYRVYYGSADSYVGVAYTELEAMTAPSLP